MAVILKLKNRLVRDELRVPRELIDTAVKSVDPEAALFRLFTTGLPPETKAVHDKRQLETIIYGVPAAGITAKEDAKWIGLRARVDRLDDAKEGNFTLNETQFGLIWDRLTSADFKAPVPPTPQWSAFLHDLFIAAGRQFDTVSAALLEDPDASVSVEATASTST